MKCPICGSTIRITDPEDFALSRSPFVIRRDVLCDECFDAQESPRDTIVDAPADRPDAVVLRGAL